jgi:hypothetical protein
LQNELWDKNKYVFNVTCLDQLFVICKG